MDLPEDGNVSDDPDFDGNEGELCDTTVDSRSCTCCSVVAHSIGGGGDTLTPQGSQGGRDLGDQDPSLLSLIPTGNSCCYLSGNVYFSIFLASRNS